MSNKRRFKDLTIRDNFMFAAVMMHKENCKKFLEMLLGIEINQVVISYEKSLIYHPEYKGVRLDVYASGENNTDSEDNYVKELQEAIRRIKENRRLENSFMTLEEIREQGKIEGKIEGKVESILELLEELGEVPESLSRRIMSETRSDILKNMLKIANKVTSYEEFEEQIKSL